MNRLMILLAAVAVVCGCSGNATAPPPVPTAQQWLPPRYLFDHWIAGVQYGVDPTLLLWSDHTATIGGANLQVTVPAAPYPIRYRSRCDFAGSWSTAASPVLNATVDCALTRDDFPDSMGSVSGTFHGAYVDSDRTIRGTAELLVRSGGSVVASSKREMVFVWEYWPSHPSFSF